MVSRLWPLHVLLATSMAYVGCSIHFVSSSQRDRAKVSTEQEESDKAKARGEGIDGSTLQHLDDGLMFVGLSRPSASQPCLG